MQCSGTVDGRYGQRRSTQHQQSPAHRTISQHGPRGARINWHAHPRWHARRTRTHSVSPALSTHESSIFASRDLVPPLRALRPRAPESGGGARRPLSLERSHLRLRSVAVRPPRAQRNKSTSADTYTTRYWHRTIHLGSRKLGYGFLSGWSNTIFSTARPFRSTYDDGDGRGGGGGSGEGKGRGLASCAGPKKLQSPHAGMEGREVERSR